MANNRRPGRPPKSLPPARHPITRRLRQLVAEVHAGNLREAASHARIPYATLRQLYRGETLNPGMSAIARLAAAYALPLDWFFEEEKAPSNPARGWVGILPPEPERGADPRYARRVVIPFAAAPLVSVAMGLEHRLALLPAAPERPIVGGATDQFEFRRRLTGFLLQPFLAARAAGAAHPLPAEPLLRGEAPLSTMERERWIAALRRLGEFWRLTLGEL